MRLTEFAGQLRAAFVSVNLFSLLCDGSTPVTISAMGDIMRYGGPIVYLFVWGFTLLGILVLADSGSIIPRRFLKTRKQQIRLDENLAANEISRQDVAKEARAVAHSSDALRVVHVTKSFDGNRVVDDVSFGVSGDVIFAMLGPNGAGKTTTFNMIRTCLVCPLCPLLKSREGGDVVPDTGDVKIKGISVVNSPRSARLALGVCPQFTAIDSQLTVREHLLIYGRLKGLRRGSELDANVESLMVATSLNMYADRLASQLSGGNQRKLSLAIALIGESPDLSRVHVRIDASPFSSRQPLCRAHRRVLHWNRCEDEAGYVGNVEECCNWESSRHHHPCVTHTLICRFRLTVLLTDPSLSFPSPDSMEEASALANKVGIISKKMLGKFQRPFPYTHISSKLNLCVQPQPSVPPRNSPRAMPRIKSIFLAPPGKT